MITTEIELFNIQRKFTSIVKNAIDIGEMLHISGAQVSRVEDTISRICYAYGAERVDVITITSLIIVTVIPNNGEAITQTRRITAQSKNMSKLDALNALSREICETLPESEFIEARLEKIKKMPSIPIWLIAISEIVVACGYSIFFGGSWLDGLATIPVALTIFLAERIFSKIHTNRIVHFLITSFIAGAVSVLMLHIGLGQDVNPIMIGAIMLLIPGVALTTAFEDLLSGDTITGLLKFCESAIVAIGIAVGFAIATFVCGGYDMLHDINYTAPYVQMIAAIISSGAYAIVIGLKKPIRLIFSALGGGIAQLSFYLLSKTGLNTVICIIIAAALCAAYSQVLARFQKTPSTVFVIPSILPLVPGKLLYYTMSYMLRGNTDKFISSGLNTLLYAIAIAFGLIAVIAVFSVCTSMIRKAKIKKHF